MSTHEIDLGRIPGIEAGKISGIGKSGKKEANLTIGHFEPIDINNPQQIQEILEIVTDPVNMKHLAGVSEETKFADIFMHYNKDPEERDGRVLIDENGHVAAVFEVSPWDPGKRGTGEDRTWAIKSAYLNRVAVRSDLHNGGIGTKVIEYAEEVAFKEHGYPSLLAGIILDNDQAKAYDEIYHEDAKEFAKDYMESDARGKMLLEKRKWKILCKIYDQGSWGYQEGEYDSVLLVQKTRTAWEDENGIPHRENGASKAN